MTVREGRMGREESSDGSVVSKPRVVPAARG